MFDSDLMREKSGDVDADAADDDGKNILCREKASHIYFFFIVSSEVLL